VENIIRRTKLSASGRTTSDFFTETFSSSTRNEVSGNDVVVGLEGCVEGGWD